MNWEEEGNTAGKTLKKRLEANLKDRKMTFEEWRKRKEAETRLKRRILKEIEAEEKLEKQEKARKFAHQRELNKSKVANWRHQKAVEAQKKHQKAKIAAKKTQRAVSVRKTESQQSYLNWLQVSVRRHREERKGDRRAESAGLERDRRNVSGSRELISSVNRKRIESYRRSQSLLDPDIASSGLHPSDMLDWSDLI